MANSRGTPPTLPGAIGVQADVKDCNGHAHNTITLTSNFLCASHSFFKLWQFSRFSLRCKPDYITHHNVKSNTVLE